MTLETKISEPRWAELFCTGCNQVIAESKEPVIAGQTVESARFVFSDGFVPPKPGSLILCPKDENHYVYFRNRDTKKRLVVA